MNKTQKEIAEFEQAILDVINKHRSEFIPYSAIIGVLHMAASDIDKEASGLPLSGDQLYYDAPTVFN
jgi:hypothetical protein